MANNPSTKYPVKPPKPPPHRRPSARSHDSKGADVSEVRVAPVHRSEDHTPSKAFAKVCHMYRRGIVLASVYCFVCVRACVCVCVCVCACVCVKQTRCDLSLVGKGGVLCKVCARKFQFLTSL